MQGETHDRDVKLCERLQRAKTKHAERFIRRAERNARAWRWTRWIGIIGGVLMLLANMHLFHQSCRVFPGLRQGWLERTGSDPSRGVTALDVKLEMHFLTMAFTSWLASILGMTVSVWMILYGIFGERRIRGDLLLAALLREHCGE